MTTSSFDQVIPQIGVEEFANRLRDDTDAPLQMVDVREPEELAIAQLENFTNLPLSRYAEWSTHIKTLLDPHAETIVMCHHGMRSAQMCQWLMNQGFTNVKNLTGGIEAYSSLVDPNIPRY